MNRDVAERWVKDLRTNPPQCKKFLYNGQGYCCLGRLCVVLGAEFEQHNSIGYPVINGKVHHTSYSLLDNEIREIAQIRKESSENLALMNDDGLTFEHIAAYIDKNWERL